MKQEFNIISRTEFTNAFYELSENDKNKFHSEVAQIMGKFGLELIGRYKLLNKPRVIENIFQVKTVDHLHEVRDELEAINYNVYIYATWDIAKS